MSKALKFGEKLHQIVEALLAAGFIPDGQTQQQHVRIPTMKSPVLGGMGGERRTLGGRARFVLPHTKLRVTIGKGTTNLYTVDNGQTTFVANYKTRDVDIPTMLRLIADTTGICTCSCHTRPDGQPNMDHEDCDDCITWHRS